MALHILLLAGGRSPKDLLEKTGASKKALIRIDDKPMYRYVLSALTGISEESSISVYTGEDKQGFEDLQAEGELALIHGGKSIVDAVSFTIEKLEKESGEDNLYKWELVICSCDIPLITNEIVSSILDEARKLNAEVVWPICERGIVESAFPQGKRTYVRTRDGVFTGGNIFWVKPHIIKQNLGLLQKLFRYRKNPIKMAGVIGFDLILNVVFGTLSIQATQQKLSKKLGICIKALITEHPEVSFDVDKVSDLIEVERIIRQRKRMKV